MIQRNNILSMMKCMILFALFQTVLAWSTKSNGPRRRVSSTQQRPPMTMYVPSNTPTTETPSITAQKMLKTPGISRTNEPRKSTVKLSQSVLASCDTLPSFRTAHGILSPETVRRMEELVDEEVRTEALKMFLERYRRNGPMSCLPLLSDPEILPHLTNAMRNVLE